MPAPDTAPRPSPEPNPDPLAVFDRQVQTLVDLSYPQLLDLDAEEFRARLAPLRELVPDLVPKRALEPLADAGAGVPFVLVTGTTLPPTRTMLRTGLAGRPGFTTMDEDDLARFRPTPDVAVPAGPGYLLLDVDPGGDLRGVPPVEALPTIRGRGRSPLTITEGVAVATHRPDLLAGGARFSLLGSRCGDARVPAIWVSRRRPRLGWCWDGAPHHWLGAASCTGRRGSADRGGDTGRRG